MQHFRAIAKTAGGTGNGGYPSPNGAPVPPPWLFPIWSNGGGGYLTVSPTYIAFDLTGNGIARINVGTGPHQQWSGNSINPAGTYLDPNSYLGPYDAALRAEAVSQNESGLYVYSAGPLIPQIQQTVVRAGTCPPWNYANGAYTGPLTITYHADSGYTVAGGTSYVQTSNFQFNTGANQWVALTGGNAIQCIDGYPDVGTGGYVSGIYYDYIWTNSNIAPAYASTAGNSVVQNEPIIRYHNPNSNNFTDFNSPVSGIVYGLVLIGTNPSVWKQIGTFTIATN